MSKNTLKQLDQLQQAGLQQGLRYDNFLKLNKLWEQYISTLLGKDDPANAAHSGSICSKMVKADLTGALVTVAQSKNPTVVGLSGLVTRESVRCLFIIQKDNAVKCLIKPGSVFRVALPSTHGGHAIQIWGDNIVHLGSERTKVRFKEKFALDLY